MAERPGAHNLALLGEEAFERRGDYPAVFCEGRWHGSADLFERSRRLAGGLLDLGVAPGDRVVVAMPNDPDVPVVYQALWRSGAAITPAVFLLSREELRHVLEETEARAVVTTDDLRLGIETAAEGLPTPPRIVSPDQLEGDPAELVPRADSDLAAVMFTGGTTGRAKGVALSHENLWLAGKAGHDWGYVPGIERGLTSLPLSHSYGLLVTVVGLHSPDRIVSVLMRWFQAETWLELAQEHAVQIAAVVPSMLHLLLAAPLEEYDLSALRYLASGGAPLAAETAHEVGRRLPWVEIREGYGLTETSALVSTNPPGRTRLGSVGLPVSGTEVRIVDDADRELPIGEVGEICCRSRSVMLGYWHAPGLTDEVMRGGWFHTGDMGRLDEDGYLYVVDRKKDLIIRGGFNVFPRDVEDALLEHPAVVQACVIGRPDAAHGEEIVAFVALEPGQDIGSAELVAFGKQRLGGYKYPREVHVLPALPLTPVGKVDRKAMRALIAVEGGTR